ncbi:succinate dehydrogenase assembly factor 2 [Dechloromonas sp. ZS-1]|uniref:FAD assembly factor SdhE n=1 Tax=Dechloromonas sp. ZS-1 TaxID=3138067 RepID=UPI0031FC8DBB
MERKDYERLRWRCIRRAFLELDIVFTRFLENGFEQLSEEQKQAFVELADMEDHDLWYLVSGKTETDDPRFAPLVALLRKC